MVKFKPMSKKVDFRTKGLTITMERWRINFDAFRDMSIGFFGMDEKSRNLGAQHPQLMYLPAWMDYKDEIPVNNLMSFILFLYSPDSPVNKRYGVPLIDRKTQALMLAGFSHLRGKDGEWAVDVQNYLIDLRNDVVIDMILEYLVMLNQKLWTEINTLEQELLEATRVRLRPVSSIDDKAVLSAVSIKANLRNDCKEIIELLGMYCRQFYGDVHAEEMKARVHKIKTTVESRAKKLLEK
jgi:hypothetical protein